MTDFSLNLRELVTAVLILMLAPAAALAQDECDPAGNRYTRSAEIELQRAQDASDPRGPEARYHRMLEILQEAFEEEGDNAPSKAYLLAAQAHLGLYEFVAADSMLDVFDELEPACRKFTADARFRSWAQVYNQGIQQYNAGNVDEALSTFETANLVYDDPRSWNFVAVIHQERGELDQAIAAYEKMYELASDEEQKRAAAINRAELLKSLGKLDEALAIYEEYSSTHPDDVLGRLNYAVALGDAGQVDEAQVIFQEFLDREDLTFRQWSEVGIGLYRASAYGEAAEAFKRAHDMRPYNKETIENLGNSLALAEEYEALKPIADTLVTRYPLETAYYRLRANSLVETGENDAALKVLEAREELPVELLNVTMIPEEEGSYRVEGEVMTRTAEPDSEATLNVDFLGEDGALVLSDQITLVMPPEGEISKFELRTSSESTLAGFTYKLQQ
jgi:tetratricopeptide (TPR) repeat protein